MEFIIAIIIIQTKAINNVSRTRVTCTPFRCQQIISISIKITTEQFLPARAALLKDYLQKTTGPTGPTVEKWRLIIFAL
jgi:hypothetical protein